MPSKKSPIDSTTTTCSSNSYYMPAEWERHNACLILYPHNTGVFRNGIDSESTSTSPGTSSSSTITITSKCGPARAEVRNVARAICEHGKEDVFLFCNTQEEADELSSVLLLKGAGDGDGNQSGNDYGNGNDNVQSASPGSSSNTTVEKNKHQIFVKVCKSDDSWCRDTGPTFVVAALQQEETNNQTSPTSTSTRNNIIGLDWNFNAYGGPEDGCYWPCTNDQKVAQNIIHILSNHYYNGINSSSDSESDNNNNNNNNNNNITKNNISHEKVDMILEGGSFHTDGEGTILTTEECLLHPNRNPDMSKDDIERMILQYLGGTKVVWLPFGIFNDEDTNGHVDNIATFARPGEIVLSWTDDDSDANYERCMAAMDVLSTEVDAKGRNFIVHKLHLPRPLHYTSEEIDTLGGGGSGGDDSGEQEKDTVEEADACERTAGERLAASYVNYYLSNDAIILPQFGDEIYDKRAEETMKAIFPDKKIACIYSREILLGGGNIHCITQQLPSLL